MLRRTLVAVVLLGLVASGCSDSDAGSRSVLAELNVAYVAEWPTPIQFGQADGAFADAVGVPINWLPFSSGGEMSEALIAGDVDIAYSQDLSSFVGVINGGGDLKLVGIAVSYPEADNCVAQGSLGVTLDNAAETLANATVMTSLGNVTHHKMLSMLEFLGVDLNQLNIVEAESGATTASAFEAGDIDVGCAFGGSVASMLASGGAVIMSGDEHENELGVFTFDIVSISAQFGEAHSDVVSAFLRATDEFNADWAANMDAQNPTIASAAGLEDVGDFLGGELWFAFPTIEEQLGLGWLGGNVAESMQGQIETLNRLGEGDPATGDFAGAVDTSYLENAN